MIKKTTFSVIVLTAVLASAFKTSNTTKTYTVDTNSTTIGWLAKKVVGEHLGVISVSKGTITVNENKIVGGTIDVDMTSITNTDLKDKEWNNKLITHLKSEDFFSVSKNPTSNLEIEKVVLKSGNDYDVTGKLTIKGITNEITFPAMIKLDDKVIVVVAKFMVDRTKFDIKYGSANFFEGLGDKAIRDEFELNVNLVATAK